MSYYWVDLIPTHQLRVREGQLMHLYRDGDDSPHLAYVQTDGDKRFFAHVLETNQWEFFDNLEDAKTWAQTLARMNITTT